MSNIKRQHSVEFKTKVALELLKEVDPLSVICSKYSIHPTQARRWKEKAIESLQNSFNGSDNSVVKELIETKKLNDELFKQIGQSKVELDWLKKKLRLSKTDKRKLIEPNNEKIPIGRQCELLIISRSGYYYQPKPISAETIDLMNRIDKIYTGKPYYGYPRITKQLQRDGVVVNHKRVASLMQTMGLQAIYPKKNTSKPNSEHLKYPYLLKGVEAVKPNQVWGADITYVRANGIWFYLVAILDWYSRYVINWKLSKNMNVNFCNEALNEALRIATPTIHNSDQGSQFTSIAYTNILKQKNIQISMDGRGRCFDNIFTERLWRTVKYEEIYLKDYTSFPEAEISLKKYFHIYNTDRLHQSLNYQTPAEVYFKS